MRHRTSLAALGLAALLMADGAGASLRIVEQAIETSTLSISLPDDVTGSIAVTACDGCKPLLLRLSPGSQYFVGKSPVTYAEFRSLAVGSGARQLNIFYDGKGRTITRLVVPGSRPAPAPAPAQPRKK